MESIYFVMSWLCHRTCTHCYEDRFRPYYGDDREQVIAQAERDAPRIIDNFPSSMQYWDWENSQQTELLRGRIILAGGEILLEPLRERVLYPALEQLHNKYQAHGGVRLIVQTTGDTLTEAIVHELLDRHVMTIAVSGIDPFHAGLETEEARDKLQDKLTALFERCGLSAADFSPTASEQDMDQPRYLFFGANPGTWIGSLWPRGRADRNELSTATFADNFCNRWSGGLNFLDYKRKGSEVSIDPLGNVFPCCIKTKKPVGNLLEESLHGILDRLSGHPVYEAISMGHPERMGVTYGWSVDEFLRRSEKRLASGGVYRNLCVGCDAFHDEFLLAAPSQSLVQLESAPAV